MINLIEAIIGMVLCVICSDRHFKLSLSLSLSLSIGTLYYMNANGQCVESEKVEHGLKHIIYSSEKSLLAAISKDLLLITFSVDKRGNPTRISEVIV